MNIDLLCGHSTMLHCGCKVCAVRDMETRLSEAQIEARRFEGEWLECKKERDILMQKVHNYEYGEPFWRTDEGHRIQEELIAGLEKNCRDWAKFQSCHPPCDGPEAATCRVCDRVEKLEAVRNAAENLVEERYVSVPPYVQAHQTHWDRLDAAIAAAKED